MKDMFLELENHDNQELTIEKMYLSKEAKLRFDSDYNLIEDNNEIITLVTSE